MKKTYKLIILIASVLVLLMQSASCIDWIGPIDIFTTFVAQNPVVGVDLSGNAVILATASDDFSTFYEKTAQLIHGAVQNIQNFPPIGINQFVNAISVNAQGNAAALWVESDPYTSNNVVRSTELINNTWQSVLSISNPIINSVQSFITPGVNLDILSHAIAVWNGFDDTTSFFNAQFNLFDGATWQSAQDIFSSADFLTSTVFSGSPSGTGIAAWCVGNPFILQAAYYNGTSWNITTLSTDVLMTCVPITAISMNTSGNAIVLWNNNSTGGLSSVSFTNGVYGLAQSIYTPLANESVDSATIALDVSGNAIALWIVFNSLTTDFTIMTNRYTNGAWGTPLTLDTNTSSFLFPNIKIDRQGNAIAVWERRLGLGGHSVHYTTYTQASNTWDLPLLLSSVGIPSSQPNLSMNAFGGATVVWAAGNPPSETIQAVYIGNQLPQNQLTYTIIGRSI